MERFLSCDWGTSSFRLRLVSTDGLKVLAEERSHEGIAGTYGKWINEGGATDRLFFYQSYILEGIKKLRNISGDALDGIPLLMSGMASSSIGMIELPYTKLPFKKDGSDITNRWIPPSRAFPHGLFLISGASTDNDVLRGEETLLAGAEADDKEGETVYIFPGTHSKHIHVTEGIVTRFNTYMTGEIFELLSSKSILSNSIQKPVGDKERLADPFFIEGVLEGSASNLLNSAFHVRTNQLFKKASLPENYHFLSGLLIGSELKELVDNTPAAIVLVCGDHLKMQYQHALQLLGLGAGLEVKDADEALLNGQWQLFKSFR